MLKFDVKQLTLAAMVAALYTVLSYFGNIFGLTYGPIQCRFAEALCVLPFLFPATVPGLFVGCFLTNLMSTVGPLDLVLGSLATLLADRSCIDSPAVHTRLAGELDPDSDIADLPVVVSVEPLSREEKERALEQVLREAEEQYRRGNLLACIATVQGVTVTYDPNGILEENIT